MYISFSFCFFTEMADDSIAVLEDRMTALEIKVFGQSHPVPEISDSILDSLLDSHKVITSSLSGREKLVNAEKRLDQLETVLDPMYEDSVMDSAAKLAFILSMERELELVTKQLVQLSELSPSLENEQLHSLPQLMKQMNKLISLTAEHQQKFSTMDEDIDDLILRYTEIINGVTAVFTTLDIKLTEMEIKYKPKKIID